MQNWPVIWLIVSGVAVALVGLVGHTLWARGRGERTAHRDSHVWKRAYHLAAELAAGRAVEPNTAALREMIATTHQPIVLASAMAVAVRQQPADVHPALYAALHRSVLAGRIRPALRSDDANTRIEALEFVEVLRIHDLFGDAAVLSRDSDPAVVRAACDAMVEIEPAAGLGVLIGLAGKHDSWVIDSIGRAADRMLASGSGPIPLSRDKWRNAPLLAQRAISESATFDAATVADAVSALIGALDSPSAAVRLASITALAGTIDHHPAAQLALAGALGAPDRMIRFATAAALSDTVAGHAILRSAAASGDGSDAARIAAEILWTHEVLAPVAVAVAS